MDIEVFTKPPPKRRRLPGPKWTLIGLLVIVIAIVLAGQLVKPTPSATPPTPRPTMTAAPTFRLQGQLVFASNWQGRGDIYTVNLDGTGLTNLTNHLAVYESPVWSPDGTRIAFISNRKGQQRAYLMSADGSQVTPVANTGPLDTLAGWSHDGRHLLLSSHRDVNGEIYAVSLDGNQVVNLTRHPAEDETPAWSPDSTRIAFASDRGSEGPRRVKQIYRMDLDGENLVQLSDFFYGASHPVWSPDGQQIAFSVLRKSIFGDSMEEDTYVMRVRDPLQGTDGSNPRLLLRQPGRTRPRSWSPDGQRLIVNHVWEVDDQVRYETLILSPFEDAPAFTLPNAVASAGWGHRWLLVREPSASISLPTAIPEPGPQPATIALVNGTLIDGTGADPVPDAAIVIRDGRIAAVQGPHAQVQVPADAQVIDVQGATILPGFINAHVHEAYDAYNLAAWAQAGVTTVRDMNAPALTIDGLQSVYAFRDVVLDHPQYARVVAASPIMTVPGGYGTLAVTSPQDARHKTIALVDAGADVIKISLEDAFLGGLPALSLAETRAIVIAAHERGVPVTAHVSRASQLEVAVAAGVDDAAHMVIGDVPDDRIARMVADDMYWVPTLELWKLAYMDHKVTDNLRRFVTAGGQVALGSDYGGRTNLRFDLGLPIHELQYMQEAGMTPMQIIVAATRNAAHVCNREDTLGTLEPGKVADVLVVDGDPLADLLALQNVRLVIRDGAVIRE